MPIALLTGGAGYVGSHVAVALGASGWRTVIVDNLSNSSKAAVERVAELAGGVEEFYEIDLLDTEALATVFRAHAIDAVLHFAGKKSVSESVADPLSYYESNVGATISLLSIMRATGVRRLIFSSSCTVYGQPKRTPVRESDPLATPASPYGRTKRVIEELLVDVALADASWHIALLRYFNPIGAHPSGLIGEDPRGPSTNLLPNVMEAAARMTPALRVNGGDYATSDGTCVRDYVHVVDIAEGHLAALERIDDLKGARAINLGTGRGHTVLEVIEAVSRVTGTEIPYEIGARRSGDVEAVWADATLAKKLLGWSAKRQLDDMCRDHWRWHVTNPFGYAATESEV